MDIEKLRKKVFQFLESDEISFEFDDKYNLNYMEEIKGTCKDNSSNIYKSKNYEKFNELEKNGTFFYIKISSRYEYFCYMCQFYKDKELLGERKKEIIDNKIILGNYIFKTYDQIKNEIDVLAASLLQFEKIDYVTYDDNGIHNKLKILGIWSKNRTEWFTTDIACSAIDFVTVPLYDTLGIQSVKYIFDKTKMSVCCIESEKFETLINIKNELKYLKILIIYDDWNINEDLVKKGLDVGYKIYFYKELIDKYKNKINIFETKIDGTEKENEDKKIKKKEELNNDKLHVDSNKVNSESTSITSPNLKDEEKLTNEPKLKNLNEKNFENINKHNKQNIKFNKINPKNICTIIFTSGSTGIPKGVMLDHLCFLNFVQSYILDGNRLGLQKYDTLLSYLPLAHIYERYIEFALLFFCAKIGYFSGNIKDILSDINELKPTFFVTVPRILQKVYSNVMDELQKRHVLIRMLVKAIIRKKKSIYMNDPTKFHHKLYDVILQPIRNKFGGKLRIQVMGSAAMDKNKLIELQMIFSTPITEGWGMTEIGIGILQNRFDNNKGTIGGVFSNVLLKVRKVDNMIYDPKGKPNRGELCVKGGSSLIGYFRNLELTKQSFDEDGFFLTGDIVEIYDNGCVRIIDRAKNIFKLAQGEYIEPEKLENIYSDSIYIDQLFIHGYSYESELVAIIVPSQNNIFEYAKKNKLNLNSEELLKLKQIHKLILDELTEISKKNKLVGFEKVRLFHLTDKPFTIENGQITPTQKIIRNNILKDYKKIIDDLYKNKTIKTT